MAYINNIDNKNDINKITQLLTDISERKEFYIFKPVNLSNNDLSNNDLSNNDLSNNISGFITYDKNLSLPGLRLTNAQLFIRNFQNPNTPFKRILINCEKSVN